MSLATPLNVAGYLMALAILVLCYPTPSLAQTTAMLQGSAFDPSGRSFLAPLVDRATSTVGHMVSVRTIQTDCECPHAS
jgi:hypothetical protein